MGKESSGVILPAKGDLEVKTLDAFKFLSTLDEGSVDLILTDPPYTISRKSGFSQYGPRGVARFAVSMEFGKWDNRAIDLPKLSRSTYRALKPRGSAIIFYDFWKLSYLADAMKDAGFKMLRVLIWEKSNPVPLNSKRAYLTNSREVAIFGVKGGRPTFHSEYDNGIYRLPIPRHNGNRIHPTQKPLELFQELILKHSNKGDLVVDPFLGSGTTAVAALKTDRRFKGSDIDSSYIKEARLRLKDATQE
ncbi:MAG: DNA-methyltransferase [Nitrospinota bacterium]